MSTILFLLLTICKFNSLHCEISGTPGMLANTIDDYDAPANVDITSKIDNDGYLPDPISSINIDYANNALILHFRKNNQNVDGDDKRRSSLLDKNFMRFGRSNSGSLMRFGKRQAESLETEPEFQFGRDENGARDSRGDNFMRFGRSQGSLMRFGRADANVGPFDGASVNRVKMSRQPLQNPMRFGRNSDRNLMRFGRGTDSSLMRFGRPDKSFMRFGRNNENLMRFGRPDSLMPISRLPKEYNDYLNDQMLKISGRSDPYVMRFGRTDKNFMRFGKLDQNFMRFGKRDNELENKTLEHGVSISSPKEDSLDSLWKTDESNQSEQETHAVNEDKNENVIPGYLMAQ